MSLLNQVLKDLDAQAAAVPSLHLAEPPQALPPGSEPQEPSIDWIRLSIWSAVGGAVLVATGWFLTTSGPKPLADDAAQVLSIDHSLPEPQPAGVTATPGSVNLDKAVVPGSERTALSTSQQAIDVADVTSQVVSEPPSQKAAPSAESLAKSVPVKMNPPSPAQDDVVTVRVETPSRPYLPLRNADPAPKVTTPTVAAVEARSSSGPVKTVKRPVETPLQRVQVALDKGDLALAEQLLRKHLQLEPKDRRGHELLVGLLVRGNRHEEALGQLEQSLPLLPDHTSLRLLQARILVDRGQTAEAVLKLEQLLVDNPAQADAMRLLAGVLQQQGEAERAAPWYRKLTTLPSAVATDWLGLAISMDGRDFRIAAAAYRRVLASSQASQPVRQYAQQRLAALLPGEAG